MTQNPRPSAHHPPAAATAHPANAVHPANAGFRWYGPTLLLLLAVLGVMLAGPGLIRSVAHARTDAELVTVRNELGSNPSLAQLSDAFKQVARAVEPSVVHIEIQSRSRRAAGRVRPGSPLDGLPEGLIPPQFRDRFGGPGGPRGRGVEPEPAEDFGRFDDFRPVGNGSGWVYRFPGSEDGDEPAADYILTNAHVVRDVGPTERIRVTLYDRTQVTARVVGQPDDATDVAVLELADADATLLHPAATGSSGVEQGEIVFAFGSPFGSQFSFSMSQGIVSAVGRQVGIIGNGGYENFIQTDAAINPGNSGGPLVNVRGEIVGMNTAIATNNRGGFGGGASNSGVGFAIPVEMATRIADRVIVDGVVRRGFLGVRIADLNPEMAQTFGYDGAGVLIQSVIEGGAAAAAGLRDGDILTAVDGEPVADAGALRRAIAARRPGRGVQVEVFRDGGIRSFDVRLGALDGGPVADAGEPEASGPAGPGAVSELARRYGITGLRTLDGSLPESLGLPEVQGVLVTGVRPGSVAAGPRVRLRPGETVVTAVMDRAVDSVRSFNEALDSFDPEKPIRLTVLQRDPSDPSGFVQSFVLLKTP